MRRSGRSIAAIVAGTAVAALGGLGLVAAWTSADADTTVVDPDAPIMTGAETIPDFAAVPTEDERALVRATRAATPPVAVEYAELSAARVAEVARPALREVEDFAWRYEPKFAFTSDPKPFMASRSEVELNLTPAKPPKGQGRLQAIKDRLEAPAPKDRKGRWVLFASDESTAVGLNILKPRSQELRRLSWSTEKVAAIGDMQAGIGWRRNGFQASLSFVDRDISIYGVKRDEQFFAFTISIKPRGKSAPRAPRDPAMRDQSYYPPRANPK